MTTKMKAYCGTYNAEAFEIDLDSYCKPIETSANDEQKREAFELLYNTMSDATFADDHCRNEDAVNGCIALHVMGYDAETWFENFCAEQGQIKERWFEPDLRKFMEHVERVCNYLSKWGPKGDEGRALNFAI